MIGVEYNGVSYTTPGNIVITNAAHWLFRGTGLSNGDTLPNILGYETDSIDSNSPVGTVDLAHSPFPSGAPQVYADMSIYTAASGANVFATGSVWWSLGLDSYGPSPGAVPGVQQITANFLAQALLPSLSLLSLNPTTVTSGNPSTGTVSLSGPAPAGGAQVTLSSSDPSVASVPPTVTVPAGATSATFTVNTSVVATSNTVSISASYAGLTQTASLSLIPLAITSLSLNPPSVTGGNPSFGTVTLNGPAPAGGAQVTLSSSDPSVASVPPSILVSAGATTTTFTVPTNLVIFSTTVTISTTYNASSQSADLAVHSLVPLL
jgi:hypothetical protein